MSKTKSYPFSVTKHQHDIEFRFNRVKNEMYDMEHGDIPWDDATYEKMNELSDQLEELMSYVYGSGGIAWIPGHLYGLAQDTVAWADNARDNR